MTFPPGSVHVGDHAELYLVAAALCLMIALRFMKRALEPLGAIVEAAAIAVVAVGLALILIVVVAVTR